MALVGAGVRVEDDDAAIAVAVGDVDLVGRGLVKDLRRLPEVGDVVAAVVHAVLADLQQELAGIRELQDLGVVGAVAGDPDVAVVVHRDAMVAVRPLVPRARPAPGFDEVAGLVIDEHRRCNLAARADRIRGRRIPLRAGLHLVVNGLGNREIRSLEVGLDGTRAMDRPDAVLGVDREADRRAGHPVIRQRLGPDTDRPRRSALAPRACPTGREEHRPRSGPVRRKALVSWRPPDAANYTTGLWDFRLPVPGRSREFQWPREPHPEPWSWPVKGEMCAGSFDDNSVRP